MRRVVISCALAALAVVLIGNEQTWAATGDAAAAPARWAASSSPSAFRLLSNATPGQAQVEPVRWYRPYRGYYGAYYGYRPYYRPYSAYYAPYGGYYAPRAYGYGYGYPYAYRARTWGYGYGYGYPYRSGYRGRYYW
ncbi:MAG: hypothetical protein AB7O59_11900 [Pirellulales bacterium]